MGFCLGQFVGAITVIGFQWFLGGEIVRDTTYRTNHTDWECTASKGENCNQYTRKPLTPNREKDD